MATDNATLGFKFAYCVDNASTPFALSVKAWDFAVMHSLSDDWFHYAPKDFILGPRVDCCLAWTVWVKIF